MTTTSTQTLTVAVAGASGLVGSALTQLLTSHGHTVRRLVRKPPQNSANEIFWNPEQGQIDRDALAGVDAVINLAGENIAEGRWSAAKKRRIRDSRVGGTQLLSAALAALPQPPRVFACASAIGFYGNRGDELVDENSPGGGGYLAEVCAEWEAATKAAREAGIRVANMRIGVVFSPEGGALAKMLPIFKLGVGGVVGSGKQYVSWIMREDLVAAMEFILTHDALAGPINLVAPQPVTNRELTKTLGSVLSRPTISPLPAFLVRLLFGEMGDELLLSSTRVAPKKLLDAGFKFQYADIESAVRQAASA